MKKNLTSLIATIISLLLIIAGTVGLILLQKPLREESLDIRKDASVDNGQVLVSGSPDSLSILGTGETTIILQANTQGAQTDGIQLVFNIIASNLGSTPTISIPSESGLQAAYQQVEQTSDGYLVSMIAIPQQIGQAFSSTSPITIAQLQIIPSDAGNIEISFDREKSKSIIHGSNPPQDALKYVLALHYAVKDDQTGDDVDEHGCKPSAGYSWCDPEQKCYKQWEETCEDDSGTGGVTVQGCNLECDSNSECEANHRCYNRQCRLVTNVSSISCQPKPDQGLNFGCNSYCADSKECDSEYSCLENKCRRADNPDDSSCAVPSSTIQKNVDASCNTTCSANTDCAANLRCYYGSCKLATNVSSTTCSAATTKTVSTIYDKSTAPKGGDLEDQEATDSTIPAAIISQPSPSPSPSMKPKVEEETALDAVVNSMSKAGIPVNLLPIIALGAGGLLLLLIIIPKIFGKKTKSEPVAPPQQSTNQESHKYEQELQTRLEELKKQPSAPSTPPVTMAKPQTPTPTIKPHVPPMVSNKPTFTPKSTMMERVKEKGINPPNS
jgi:hypothetical protein